MSGKPIPLIQRFEKRYIPEPNSGCWLWIGHVVKSRSGTYYGTISGVRGHTTKNLLAHRASYMLSRGEVAKSAQIDHICQNTLCVNPDHLQVVASHKEHGAITRSRRKRCRRGHLLDEKNTWYEKNGTRHCRRCHADREARNRQHRRIDQWANQL